MTWPLGEHTCVYLCVCGYKCVYRYMYMCVDALHIYVDTCVHVCICVVEHVCIYLCMCAFI